MEPTSEIERLNELTQNFQIIEEMTEDSEQDYCSQRKCLRTDFQYSLLGEHWTMDNPMFTNNNDEWEMVSTQMALVADLKCSATEPLKIHELQENSTWKTLGILPEMKSNYTFVCVETSDDVEIFIIGGRRNTDNLRSVEVYSKKKNLRRSAAPMIHCRTRPSATLHNGEIHVAGGYDGVYMKSTEIYDKSTNSWRLGAALQRVRADAQLVSCGGALFVLGGYDGVNYVSEIERLNELTQKFEIIGEMPGPRAGFGACAFRGRIWIAGGWTSSNNTLKTVRSFNPLDATWRDEKSMELARKYFTLLAESDGIWAVRGNSADWKVIPKSEKLEVTHKEDHNNNGAVKSSSRAGNCDTYGISLFGLFDVSIKLRS